MSTTHTKASLVGLSSDELDEIYFNMVGYRPINDDGVSRQECIDLILGMQTKESDARHEAGIPQPSPSQHTPGPYSDKGIEDWINANEIAAGNHLAIDSFRVRDFILPLRNINNELLEALELCLPTIEATHGKPDLVRQIKSAIAKAKSI